MSTSARSSDSPFRHLTYRRGGLCVEGVPVERIAREFGTPVYIYSSVSIRNRLDELRSAFGARDPLICYAMKANSNLSICRILARAGAGADVVSGGELRKALEAGFDPRKIIFSGVGKTSREIEFALKAGLLALNLESEEEMEAVGKAAARLKRRAPVSIRINPDVDAGTHKHVTTGRADNKFGVDRHAAMRMYRRANRDERLEPVGIQCHLGSQITRTEPYRRALRTLLDLASELKFEGCDIQFIDIGGGMGVAEGNVESAGIGSDKKIVFAGKGRSLPLADLASSILTELESKPGLKLVLEPGRFLVADSGILATRVLYRKQSSRSRFVVVDAGMNDLIRPALYGASHPIVPARPGGGNRVLTDVVGPVCETADFFARGRSLPWPEPGDIWAILQTGAYGFSMSSQYNSRLRPAEVLVEGGTYRMVRQRERYEDLVRLEIGK